MRIKKNVSPLGLLDQVVLVTPAVLEVQVVHVVLVVLEVPAVADEWPRLNEPKVFQAKVIAVQQDLPILEHHRPNLTLKLRLKI